MLFSTGDLWVGDTTFPVYELLPFESNRPSAELLAYRVTTGNASAVRYEYRRIGRGDEGFVPGRVAYRCVPVDVLAEAPEGEVVDTHSDTGVVPIISHELVLRDGRRMKGRLISRDHFAHVFVVVVGSVEQEMRFKNANVDEVIVLPE